MSEKVWLGAIFLKEEGGYEIVLKSLKHYKKRLKTLGNSPELKDAAAMFASVLNQQAAKTIPEIDKTLKKVEDSLEDPKLLNSLSKDIAFLEKSLMCYEADIEKAQNLGHEYFVNLVGDVSQATKDLGTIKNAIKKIKEFSE